jgi:ABC-type phosphate transport system substrate-binding protein
MDLLHEYPPPRDVAEGLRDSLPDPAVIAPPDEELSSLALVGAPIIDEPPASVVVDQVDVEPPGLDVLGSADEPVVASATRMSVSLESLLSSQTPALAIPDATPEARARRAGAIERIRQRLASQSVSRSSRTDALQPGATNLSAAEAVATRTDDAPSSEPPAPVVADQAHPHSSAPEAFDISAVGPIATNVAEPTLAAPPSPVGLSEVGKDPPAPMGVEASRDPLGAGGMPSALDAIDPEAAAPEAARFAAWRPPLTLIDEQPDTLDAVGQAREQGATSLAAHTPPSSEPFSPSAETPVATPEVRARSTGSIERIRQRLSWQAVRRSSRVDSLEPAATNLSPGEAATTPVEDLLFKERPAPVVADRALQHSAPEVFDLSAVSAVALGVAEPSPPEPPSPVDPADAGKDAPSAVAIEASEDPRGSGAVLYTPDAPPVPTLGDQAAPVQADEAPHARVVIETAEAEPPAFTLLDQVWEEPPAPIPLDLPPHEPEASAVAGQVNSDLLSLDIADLARRQMVASVFTHAPPPPEPLSSSQATALATPEARANRPGAIERIRQRLSSLGVTPSTRAKSSEPAASHLSLAQAATTSADDPLIDEPSAPVATYQGLRQQTAPVAFDPSAGEPLAPGVADLVPYEPRSEAGKGPPGSEPVLYAPEAPAAPILGYPAAPVQTNDAPLAHAVEMSEHLSTGLVDQSPEESPPPAVLDLVPDDQAAPPEVKQFAKEWRAFGVITPLFDEPPRHRPEEAAPIDEVDWRPLARSAIETSVAEPHASSDADRVPEDSLSPAVLDLAAEEQAPSPEVEQFVRGWREFGVTAAHTMDAAAMDDANQGLLSLDASGPFSTELPALQVSAEAQRDPPAATVKAPAREEPSPAEVLELPPVDPPSLGAALAPTEELFAPDAIESFAAEPPTPSLYDQSAVQPPAPVVLVEAYEEPPAALVTEPPAEEPSPAKALDPSPVEPALGAAIAPTTPLAPDAIESSAAAPPALTFHDQTTEESPAPAVSAEAHEDPLAPTVMAALRDEPIQAGIPQPPPLEPLPQNTVDESTAEPRALDALEPPAAQPPVSTLRDQPSEEPLTRLVTVEAHEDPPAAVIEAASEQPVPTEVLDLSSAGTLAPTIADGSLAEPPAIEIYEDLPTVTVKELQPVEGLDLSPAESRAAGDADQAPAEQTVQSSRASSAEDQPAPTVMEKAAEESLTLDIVEASAAAHSTLGATGRAQAESPTRGPAAALEAPSSSPAAALTMFPAAPPVRRQGAIDRLRKNLRPKESLDRLRKFLSTAAKKESSNAPAVVPEPVPVPAGPAPGSNEWLRERLYAPTIPDPLSRGLREADVEKHPGAGPWTLTGIAAVVMLAVFCAGYFFTQRPRTIPPPDHYLLTLSGSDAIGSSLMPQLVQGWLTSKGGTDIAVYLLSDRKGNLVPDGQTVFAHLDGHDVQVLVNAHGSDAAFRDLRGGEADIGMASRRVSPNEAHSLSRLGDLRSPRSEHLLALSGVAVIVPQTNSVPRLSRHVLKQILSCEIETWREVPGVHNLSGPIHVYAPHEPSGAWETLEALVLAGAPPCAAKRIQSDDEMDTAVANDPMGVGFVGSSYTKTARVVPVSDGRGRGVAPTPATIAAGNYPLAQRLYLYVAAHPANTSANDFLKYALSAPGQAVVRDAGAIAIDKAMKSPEAHAY